MKFAITTKVKNVFRIVIMEETELDDLNIFFKKGMCECY